MTHFDADLLASPDLQTPGGPVELLSGAVLYGAQSCQLARQLAAALPGKEWRHAAELSALIGPADERFPKSDPDVLELRLPPAELVRYVNEPAHYWFPLLNSAGRRRIVRLALPPGAEAVSGIRRLARSFPGARFIVDPFQNGPDAAWKAQVRLAEPENIWLTTRGLFPGKACRWSNPADINEAFYFTTGEVGAGKLLFASGETTAVDATVWLDGIAGLDAAQRRLIAEGNAFELLARND